MSIILVYGLVSEVYQRTYQRRCLECCLIDAVNVLLIDRRLRLITMRARTYLGGDGRERGKDYNNFIGGVIITRGLG